MQCRIPPVIERIDFKLTDSKLGATLKQDSVGIVYIETFENGIGGELGAAERCGLLHVGDCLLSVGDSPIEFVSFDVVMKQIRNAPRPLLIVFGRPEVNSREKILRDKSDILKQNRLKIEKERVKNLQSQQRERRDMSIGISSNNTSSIYTAKDFTVSEGQRFRIMVIVVVIIVIILMLLEAMKLFSIANETDAVIVSHEINIRGNPT